MISSLSPTSIGSALKCGEQFRRRYILGERIPPGIAMGRGIGVHNANDANLNQKVDSRVDLPVTDLTDAARDGFVNSFRNGVYLVKEDVPAKASLLNEGLNQAIRATKLYHKEVAPTIVPVASEEKLSLDIGLDVPLVGIMDYREEVSIGDLKTTARTPPKGTADKELQAVVYSYLYEKVLERPRPLFKYNYLVTLQSGEKHHLQETTATDAKYKSMLRIARQVYKMMLKGVFMPADPGHWVCAPRWCGYHRTCDYVGNGVKKWA